MNGATRICPKRFCSRSECFALASSSDRPLATTDRFSAVATAFRCTRSLHGNSSCSNRAISAIERRELVNKFLSVKPIRFIGAEWIIHVDTNPPHIQKLPHARSSTSKFKHFCIHRITQRTHACSMLIRVFVGRNASVFFSQVIPLNALSFCCRPFRNCRPWNRSVTLERIFLSSQLKRRTDLRFRSAAGRTDTRTLWEIKMEKEEQWSTQCVVLLPLSVSVKAQSDRSDRRAACIWTHRERLCSKYTHSSLSIKIYF